MVYADGVVEVVSARVAVVCGGRGASGCCSDGRDGEAIRAGRCVRAIWTEPLAGGKETTREAAAIAAPPQAAAVAAGAAPILVPWREHCQ